MHQKASLLLAVAMVVALVAILIHPLTGWLARAQLTNLFTGSRQLTQILTDLGIKREDMPLGWALPPGRADDPKEAYAKVLAAHPGDAELAVAVALQGKGGGSARLATLRALPPSFPQAATVLRYATLSELRLNNRSVDQDQLNATGYTSKNSPADPAGLAQGLDQARRGGTLDPDNAFFPAMEAIALYGLHRDNDAAAALHRAALCPRFDDGIRAEMDGTRRLRELARGPQLGIIEIAVAGATLFPHYAQLRALARLGTVQAITREKTGDPVGGLALRRDVMALGEKIRDQSPTIVGTLVGGAMVAIPTGRPGGAPALPPSKDDSETRAKAGLKRWEAYAKSQHAPELAQRAQRNHEAITQDKANWKRVESRSTLGIPRLLRLFISHLLTINTLAILVLVLLLGATAALVQRRCSPSSQVPLVVLWIMALTLCPLLLPVALVLLWKHTKSVGTLLVAWLVPYVLLGLCVWWEALMNAPWLALMGLIQGLSSDPEEGASGVDTTPLLGFLVIGMGALLSVPGLWLAVVSLREALRRKDKSLVLPRLAATAIPLAAFLCLVYVGLMVRLAGQEAQYKAEVREQARSERAYYTRLGVSP